MHHVVLAVMDEAQISLTPSGATVTRLVVWSFNDTILQESADKAVIKLLPNDKLVDIRYYKREREMLGETFTSVMYMNECLAALAKCRIGEPAIRELITSIPVSTLAIDAIREFYNENVMQILISESNVEFICMLLDHYGIRNHFRFIHGNHARWIYDEALQFKKLVVKSVQNVEHHSCPNNTSPFYCKKLALERIIQHLKIEPWITCICQGLSDLCATTLLRPGDVICIKADRPLYHRYITQSIKFPKGVYVIKYESAEEFIMALRTPDISGTRRSREKILRHNNKIRTETFLKPTEDYDSDLKTLYF